MDKSELLKIKPGMIVKLLSTEKIEQLYFENRDTLARNPFFVNFRKYYLCGKEVRVTSINTELEYSIFRMLYHIGVFPCEIIDKIIDDRFDNEQYYRCSLIRTADYMEPKLVKALWLKQTEGDVEYESLHQMVEININKYIGYYSCFVEKRSILIYYGLDEIKAITGNNVLADQKDLEFPFYKGKFYIFDYEHDLLLWVAEDSYMKNKVHEEYRFRI